MNMYKKFLMLKEQPKKVISPEKLCRLISEDKERWENVDFLPPEFGDLDFGRFVIKHEKGLIQRG